MMSERQIRQDAKAAQRGERRFDTAESVKIARKAIP